MSDTFSGKEIMKADRILDCIGLYCPMPIVKTSQEIKKMKAGETLEVLSDDKGIKEDMPAWCRTTGNEFLGMEEQNGEIKVFVRKLKD
jgi:tRNA 2-thiouridine synthesizing protein A